MYNPIGSIRAETVMATQDEIRELSERSDRIISKGRDVIAATRAEHTKIEAYLARISRGIDETLGPVRLERSHLRLVKN